MVSKLTFLSAAENRETFFTRIAMFFPVSDHRYQTIQRAYNCAKDAFRGKYRDDGKTRYFEHLRSVALILLDYLRVKDYELIVAALLHDIVEDIPSWTIERVRAEFGDRVALLVDWLSKPPLSEFSSKKERDRVYHQRFSNAPRDFFLIKLSDRWHNLLTLESCSTDKIARKVEETRTHYLPYAEDQCILIHEIEFLLLKLS